MFRSNFPTLSKLYPVCTAGLSGPDQQEKKKNIVIKYFLVINRKTKPLYGFLPAS